MIAKSVLFCFLSSIFIFLACKEPQKTESEKQIIIDIQPFSDISQAHIDYVNKELLKIYANIEIKKTIPLPKSAYYPPRNRYRADSLISYLKNLTPDGHVTIGLTSKDISSTKGDIIDYGIMGLGYCPGKSCVTSIFRLSKKNQLEQLFKLSIHELGHTQGLPHCPEKGCFMRDAEGKNRFDEETDFCAKCKAHLRTKGWKLKD